MLTRIEALRFRSLRYIVQDVSPFQVLVGPNASGKSSFLDVVSFLGDLLDVGPTRAIGGDSSRGVQARAADPSNLIWMREGATFQLAVELAIPEGLSASVRDGRFGTARYEVAVDVGTNGGETAINAETLWLLPSRKVAPPQPRLEFPGLLFEPRDLVGEPDKRSPPGWRKVVNKIGRSGNDYFRAETSDWNSPFRLGPAKSALANLPLDESRFPISSWARSFLMEGVQRVALNAQAIRTPSPPGSPTTFLPDGSNLPWVVNELLTKSPDRFDRWTAHVRTALHDVKSISTIERPEDRHRYLVLEYTNGLRAPSWVLSDGTLRLLALTLLAYLPAKGGVYLIEEPENGIHPRGVETIFQSLTSSYEAQILCATHSPVVLGLAQPRDVLCFAKDSRTGATDIVRGDAHPQLQHWRGDVDLGTLFAAGVLG